MKKLFTLILFISVLFAYSQPVLQSSQMAPFGSEFYYKHLATFAGIDTALQGANRTWNFSNVTTSPDPDYTVTIFDPSQTVHASTFPAANYGLLEGPSMYYNFYNVTSTQMERIGGWDAGGYTMYSDGQIELKFPFTNTTSFYDSSFQSGNSIYTYYYCDNLGYGSILVPGKTYNNVIMSRVFLDAGFQIQQYIWFDTNTGQPVFSYIPPNGFVPEAGIFLYNTNVGIDETQISGLQYNNPVSSMFNVAFVTDGAFDYKYEIVNTLGEVVHSGSFAKSSLQKFSIDLSNEQSGLYLMNLKSSNQFIKSIKFLKM